MILYGTVGLATTNEKEMLQMEKALPGCEKKKNPNQGHAFTFTRVRLAVFHNPNEVAQLSELLVFRIVWLLWISWLRHRS